MDENAVGALSIVIIFVVFPIVLAYTRRVWKGTSGQVSRIPDDTPRRLAEIQQSIDALALEVERISEGQRFVTKILSEKQPAALERGGVSSKSSHAAD